MKTTSRIIVCILSIIIIYGCSSDSNPTTTSGDPTKSANVGASEFPSSVTSGDPRGFYAPNTPLIHISGSLLGSPLSYEAQTNTGTGTLKLEGSSATGGTYTGTNLKFDVKGLKLKVTIAGQTVAQDIPTETIAATYQKTSGTWVVDSKGQMILDQKDTLGPYTVNSKGLFFIRTINAADFGVPGNDKAAVVIAFKK